MNQYPAKLLLFGEYSIIYGSQALATPINDFYGEWIFDANNNKVSNSLKDFCTYLEENQFNYLDLKQLSTDINNGLRFRSNIAIGYGLGSSGSLCAGLLHKYKTDEVNAWDLTLLQKELGRIESFFHGRSSGLDPLVSYLNKAILVKESGKLETITSFSPPKMIYTYLLDSGIPRKTESLVNSFISRYKDANKLEEFQREYIPIVNQCIEFWLLDNNDILSKIKELSILQLKYFNEYIPDHILKVWKELSDRSDIAFKLCGAGGGGFFLMFTNTLVQDLEGLNLKRIFWN